jgi:hypothetical protein
MVRIVGGSWQVGTKNGETVYLDRYSGPDATGELIINANMSPEEARVLGSMLIDKANQIDRDEEDTDE